MSFLASVGVTNVDLMYVGMPRVPQEGEEIFSQDFRVLLGGGAPGTAVNAARLGIPTHLATYLGSDLFSGFARAQFEQNGVSPYNLAAEGETGIPVMSPVPCSRPATVRLRPTASRPPSRTSCSSGYIPCPRVLSWCRCRRAFCRYIASCTRKEPF